MLEETPVPLLVTLGIKTNNINDTNNLDTIVLGDDNMTLTHLHAPGFQPEAVKAMASCCAPPTPDQIDPDKFCVVEKAVCMYMDGFHLNGPEYGCIMLFFKAWTLDTPVKFVFGCIGCVLLGILTQAIVKLKGSKMVEEKFEKYFGYSGRRNFRKIVYIDPKNYKFRRNFENWKTKWDKNSAKI